MFLGMDSVVVKTTSSSPSIWKDLLSRLCSGCIILYWDHRQLIIWTLLLYHCDLRTDYYPSMLFNIQVLFNKIFQWLPMANGINGKVTELKVKAV